MDLPSITHEIHQLHIIETTHNRMQVVLPIIFIGILLLINVFFLFQIMNDTKSALFAYMVKAKNPCIPQISQKAPVLANYAKFADHFSIWTTRKGNLKFYSELHKIHSIRQPTQRIT